MLPFSGKVLDELLPEGQTPISYLLKKDVPVYFKVDQIRHLVWHSFRQKLPRMDEIQRKQLEQISWVSATADELNAIELPRQGLHESIAYLRMDNASLEEVAHSGSCRSPRFSRWGLAVTRTYRVVRNDRRGRPIKEEEEITTVSNLMRVEFEKAFVIDKGEWDRAKSFGDLGVHVDLLEFSADLMVQREDLFLDASDIARLKQQSLSTIKRVAYPFRHREHMPGLYWMFQAAYTLNGLGRLDGGDEGVGRWLTANAPEKTYRYRSVRTAEKFVWSKLDRNQGGEERGEFDVEKIDSLHGDGARSRYQFDFVSDGLAMILAIADLWFDLVEEEPNAALTVLAQKLMVNGFGGLEIGDLVYLIAGKRMDGGDELNLMRWVDQKNGKAKESGEKEVGWRPVIDREDRERWLKKKARETNGAI